MKKCPFCAEEIQDDAVKCKYCKEFLNKPEDSQGKGKLTPEQLARERGELATPDVRPCDFDKTFEAWIDRISLWGKIRFYHSEPEFGIKRKEITQEKFLNNVASDQDIVKAVGKWDLERTAFNKVRMWRVGAGLDGKSFTEEYFIEIEMRPDAFNK